MVLVTCPHCGAKVDDPSGTCPKCGLPISQAPSPPGDDARGKKPSAYAPLLPALVGAILVAGAIAAVWSIHDHMTKTAAHVTVPAARDAKADEVRISESMRRATLGNIILRQAQVHEDNYKLDSATLMEDGAICYRYHARNESGEMIAETAVVTPDSKMAMGDTAAKREVWEESCSGRGTDVTPRIGR